MRRKGKNDAATRALRRNAENKLAEGGGRASGVEERDPLALVHELEVHQIELEMQNEALRRAQWEADGLRQKYQDLYDFAPVGYVTIGPDGTIREANEAAAFRLGIARKRLRSAPFVSFLDISSVPVFRAFMQQALATGTRQSCEVELPWVNKVCHLLIEGIAVPAPEGKTLEVRAALIDVSERREMEKRIGFLNGELERKAEALAAVNRDLEAFGWTVTNELKRPLTYIHSAMEVLTQDADRLSHQQREMADIIRSSCVDMSKMITTIFKLSRSAWGALRCTATDLSRLAQDIAVDLRLTEPARRVTFVIPSGLVANCNRELTRIVLENLLENAWKYTAQRDEARIEFGSFEQEAETVYFVRDNGIGFDAEQAKDIFAPGFNLAATKELMGSGIGLATVKTVIQRHGGRVWAEGGEDKGAAIFFTFSNGHGDASGAGMPDLPVTGSFAAPAGE